MTMIKMPLACLALILYAYYFYRKKKRLRTEASFYFNLLVYAAIIHLIADAVTEYTVNHRDLVPEAFNYAWHIVFLCSVLCICMLMYLHLLSHVERGIGKRKKTERLMTYTVWIVVLAAIFILPIEYLDTPYGSYSLGPKAYALYAGVIYVLLLLLFNLFIHWGKVDPQKRQVMLLSVIIFLFFALVQIALPYVLLTGAGTALITIGIITSMEESNQYLDYESGLYNSLACQTVLEELKCRGEPFSVLTYIVLGSAKQSHDLICGVGEKLQHDRSVICALLSDDLLVILPAPFGHASKASFPEALPSTLPPDSLVKEYSKQFLFHPDQSVDSILQVLADYKNSCEEGELYRDELTWLFRRNAFIQKVSTSLARNEVFTMLMIDIDNFKSINDTYGHSYGDDILRGVAKAFRDTLRERDVICRFGGDEFAILLANVEDRKALDDVVHRLSDAVAQVPCAVEKGLPLQLSIGARFHPASELCSFEELYQDADKALYEAKKQGKGRCVIC